MSKHFAHFQCQLAVVNCVYDLIMRTPFESEITIFFMNLGTNQRSSSNFEKQSNYAYCAYIMPDLYSFHFAYMAHTHTLCCLFIAIVLMNV